MWRRVIERDRILVIESNEVLAMAETTALEDAGYAVAKGTDALDGLKKLYEVHPDLIVVAREQSMIGGNDSYLRIRQASYIPIIVLGDEEHAVETLELGADAYMAWPPSLIELVARVKALLRRKRRYKSPGDSHQRDNGNHHLDNDEGGPGSLTQTEFRLASCLVLNRGRLLGHSQIINEVWGGKKVDLATLHFYIRQLRRKLIDLKISGLRGVGYCVPVDSSEA